MNPHTLQTIENKLGLTLPAYYVAFLDEYPEELLGLYIEIVRNVPPELRAAYKNSTTTREYPFERNLFNKLTDVVDATEEFREWVQNDDGTVDAEHKRFLAIGGDGGDAFLLDTSIAESPVNYFDPEIHEISQYGDSLQSYASDVALAWRENIANQAILEPSQSQHRDASEAKPWWKFWALL